jgi:hypothetical protein
MFFGGGGRRGKRENRTKDMIYPLKVPARRVLLSYSTSLSTFNRYDTAAIRLDNIRTLYIL